jgi:hypothetical protein
LCDCEAAKRARTHAQTLTLISTNPYAPKILLWVDFVAHAVCKRSECDGWIWAGADATWRLCPSCFLELLRLPGAASFLCVNWECMHGPQIYLIAMPSTKHISNIKLAVALMRTTQLSLRRRETTQRRGSTFLRLTAAADAGRTAQPWRRRRRRKK